MGGRGSGRLKMSSVETLEEIQELLLEIQEQLEAAHNKMDVLSQRVPYYTKTVSKRS